MSRWLLAAGPAVLLASCALAFAQEPAGAPLAVAPSSGPGVDYLLSMGPYGVLVWAPYLLGKGVRVTVQVELSERDRELIEEVGKAIA